MWEIPFSHKNSNKPKLKAILFLIFSQDDIIENEIVLVAHSYSMQFDSICLL